MKTQKSNVDKLKRAGYIQKLKVRKKKIKRDSDRIKIGNRFFYLFKNSNYLSRLIGKIKSIGPMRTRLVCTKVGISTNFALLKTRPRCFNKLIINNVTAIIHQSFLADKLTTRFVKERINKKMKIGSLYNIRVLRGLPVHGQRNKTNSRAARSYFKRLNLTNKKL